MIERTAMILSVRAEGLTYTTWAEKREVIEGYCALRPVSRPCDGMSRLFHRMFRRDRQWRHFGHKLGGFLARELDCRACHGSAQFPECKWANEWR